jgi:hypothetical protein
MNLLVYAQLLMAMNRQESEKSEPALATSPVKLPTGILNQLDDTVNQEVPWILKKLLAEGEQMLIFGAPKVGKSQFALQMAMCVALGEPFLNWSPHKRGRVLYLNFEMGNRSFMSRIALHYSHLMEEKKKRECLENGHDFIVDPQAWHRLGDETPPGNDLLNEVNEAIKDHFFFSADLKNLEGDHVTKAASDQVKGKGATSKEEIENSRNQLVLHWQSIIEAIRPDLIIFDTLSKSHAIDERDNSEIQQVLLRIRQICSIPVISGDLSGVKDEKQMARKDIAHVIIHHARKLPGENSGKGGGFISLDNIRGGSAIRAEADLIIGIFGKAKKLTIALEARNLAPDEQFVQFERFAFSRFEPPAPEIQKGFDDALMDCVRNIFVESKMRGLQMKTLEARVKAKLRKNAQGEDLTDNEIKRLLKSLADNDKSQFEILMKKGNEEETAKFPYERGGGKTLYWIKDESAWLGQAPLGAAILNHKPYTIRKSPKNQD